MTRIELRGPDQGSAENRNVCGDYRQSDAGE
jgi:hypothetical protein